MAEPFGALLRRHRTRAMLTQERLAEMAGMSAKGIAALEAGRRRAPRASTVTLLLDALGLEGADRDALVAAAIGAESVGDATATPDPSVAPRTGGATTGRVLGDAPIVTHRASFVGRPAELHALRQTWTARTRVVVVSGEAGVGKTRLVHELVQLVRPEAPVLWGRCTPDRLGAYEPFMGPLRAVMRDVPRAVEHAAGLARFLPDLAGDRAWSVADQATDPDVERRLLFEAATAVLATLGPFLLVIDDIHWADAGSLALLAHLATRPELDAVIVVTVRSTDQDAANASALADLRRHTSVERIALTGLGGDDVASLVGELAGDWASADLVAAVRSATEGNPLFVEELTQHLVEHGWSQADGDATLPVPTGVRETLVQRLATLSSDAQSLLRTGAALGRTFDADLAARVAELPADRVLPACEESLLSRLVTEASVHDLSFSHALVQQAVYESASARRRHELHRRAAVELERQFDAGRSAESTVFEIARHWELVAAVDGAAAAHAATWARRAGDLAAAGADINAAIERYERAERWGDGRSPDHVETLLCLGSALSARSRRKEADDRFREALALAAELDDRTRYARAAIGLASTVRYGHSDPERIAALERAIAELPESEDVLRTMAAAMWKRQLGFDMSEDAYRKRQVAARIVLDAVSRDDLSPELLLTLGRARDAITVDDPRVLARLSRETIAVATPRRQLQVLAHGWFGSAWAALELGDGDGWHGAVASFTAVANELALPFELSVASTMAATTALMEGRYADSERLAQVAFDLGADADPNAAVIHLTSAVMRGIDQGHGAAMVELMQASRQEMAIVPTFMGGFAGTAALSGAHDLAREVLDEFAAAGFDNVRRDLEWLPVMGFLCQTAAEIGARDHAPVLYEMLAAHPARMVRVGPLAGWWGPIDHHLGGLCRVMGRLDEAEARLRRAVATCDDLQARPWACRCRYELARILDARGGAGGEPASLRRDADAVVAALGAVGIVDPATR